MNSYIKYAYFLGPEELPGVEAGLKARPAKIYRARRMVCELLHPQREAGIALPEVWNKNCRRQGSWYRASSNNGEILVVTSFPLEGRRGVKIAPSDFQPSRRPSPEEVMNLAQSSAYLKVKPAEWDTIDDFDREQSRLLRQGLLKLGLATPEESGEAFDSVFPGHCANHANFIEPGFYLERGGKKVPYSLGSTLRVCSACVELFDLLGDQFEEKLVVLCPGAVVSTGLPPDRYFSVTKFDSP
ncbi:MAG: hypothetical protein NT056_09460 [Proteobacteria bacterium]|nr:hypothetical protein [Pseudomonadota bacterium]